MLLFRAFCLVLFSFVSSTIAVAQVAQPTDRPEDRTQLRALLVKATDALNTRNFDGIAAHLHSNFTIVTVDNQKFVGIDAFKKYYLGLFEGPNALLSKLETKMVVDEATRFLDDNTGVVYGTSQDTYHFRDGDVRTMNTRWSAVTEKEAGGWKLVNAHFSANLLDNPVLDAAKRAAVKTGVIAGIIGLVLGALIVILVRRNPRP